MLPISDLDFITAMKFPLYEHDEELSVLRTTAR